MQTPNAPQDNMFEDDADFFGQAMRYVGKKQLTANVDSSAAFKSSLSYFKCQILAQLEDIGSYSKYVRQPPPIYLDLTDESRLNAFTFNYLGRGVIALSGAIPSIIHSTMFRLLSDRAVMEDIGNPESELPTVPFIPFTIDYTELAMHHAASNISIESYIPKDPTREATARFMATMALHFIIAHEFRHIQAGHNDYNLQVIRHPLIEEVSHLQSDTNKAMISQAMEMDADAFGILSLLCIVRRVSLNLEQEKHGDFLALLSVYIVFRLFELANLRSSNWLSLSHPPPAMRNFMMIATVDEAYVRRNSEELLNWLNSIAPRIIEIGEVKIDRLFGVANSKLNIRKITGPEGLSHINKITEMWARIEPDIAKFSYVSFDGLTGTK